MTTSFQRPIVSILSALFSLLISSFVCPDEAITLFLSKQAAQGPPDKEYQ